MKVKFINKDVRIDITKSFFSGFWKLVIYILLWPYV
jgi:hypothetical protein